MVQAFKGFSDQRHRQVTLKKNSMLPDGFLMRQNLCAAACCGRSTDERPSRRGNDGTAMPPPADVSGSGRGPPHDKNTLNESGHIKSHKIKMLFHLCKK